MPPGLPETPLEAEQRHSLYLAVKESLANAAKYSGASELWLRVALDGRALRLRGGQRGRRHRADSLAPSRRGADGHPPAEHERDRVRGEVGREAALAQEGAGAQCAQVELFGHAVFWRGIAAERAMQQEAPDRRLRTGSQHNPWKRRPPQVACQSTGWLRQQDGLAAMLGWLETVSGTFYPPVPGLLPRWLGVASCGICCGGMTDSAANPDVGDSPPARFQTTRWSLVLRAGQRDAPGSAEALEKLCRACWLPLYAFARREGCPPEEAQDLTQEFFSRLLARDFLQTADPQRGRFRSFLLTAFKHLLLNERRAALRHKRGGGAAVFSLDEQDAEGHYLIEPADGHTPDLAFERRWAEAILARVLDRVAAEYAGHAVPFAELQRFLIEPRGSAAFAEVAARLGVTEGALKSLVHRLRRRYAAIFQEEVAQTLADPADVEDEIRHLLAALSA